MGEAVAAEKGKEGGQGPPELGSWNTLCYRLRCVPQIHTVAP